MKFDLLTLHGDGDTTPRKWICAMGSGLSRLLDDMMKEIIEARGVIRAYVKVDKEALLRIYTMSIRKAGSQKALTDVLSVNRQDLYKWRECKRRIHMPILIKLAEFSESGIDANRIILESRRFISGISRGSIAKMMSKELNISLIFTERIVYGKRPGIPLIFITKFLELWGELLNKSKEDTEEKKWEIIGSIDFLKQNTNRAYRVMAIKELTPDLSELVGGMLADGTVSSNCNVLCIMDGDKVNIEEFSNLVDKVFGAKPRVHKDVCKAWKIKIDSKVIHRYLRVFFQFDAGKKRGGYDIPQIIKSADVETRKRCAKGVMSFDGFVLLKGGVGLNIGSKMLRDSVFAILEQDGISVKMSNTEDSTGMWRLYSAGSMRIEQYEKWASYFVKGSDKWYKICETIGGYKECVSSLEGAHAVIEGSFPSASNSKVTVDRILRLFIENGEADVGGILNLLKLQGIEIRGNSLLIYLRCLRQMNIIAKKRVHDNTNIYILNRDVTSSHK